MKLQLGSKSIEIERLDEKTLRVDGKVFQVDGHELGPGTWSLIVDGRPINLSVLQDQGKLVVVHNHHSFEVRLEGAEDIGDLSGTDIPADEKVFAKMPGKILQVPIALGDEVAAGARLLILEAMKMENEIQAGFSGIVTELAVKAGDIVSAGQHLLTLSSPKDGQSKII